MIDTRTILVACIPTVLLVLGFFVRWTFVELQRRRFSRTITVLHQIIDGRGFGAKDEGTDRKGKQCVPRTWLLDRADELDKELKALRITMPNVATVPFRSHVIGSLFRLRALLEDRNVSEARRFGRDFTKSLREHPWDQGKQYLSDTDSTLVDATAIADDYANSQPT